MDPMPHVPDAVSTLKRELRDIFGARLRSLVAYGLHTNEAAGAHDLGAHAGAHAHEHTLTQTMAVVDTIAHDDLRACAARVGSWHDVGLATPLLVAAHEFERSLDAFPLEFGAILADHVVVSGKNPFEGLRVEAADVRRACELQARSHLLHLREGYLETRENADALAVLIVESAAPFAALLAGIARLQGASAGDAAASGRLVERLLDVPDGVVSKLVALAGVTEIPAAEATRIFPAYLDAVEKLVRFVDGWKA